MKSKVCHVGVMDFSVVDTGDIVEVMSKIDGLKSIQSVHPSIKDGETVLEFNFSDPVDESLVHLVVERVSYGGDVPTKDDVFEVKSSFEVRPYTSSYVTKNLDLTVNNTLTVVDITPTGDIVFVVKGDNHHLVYAVMSRNEYVQLIDDKTIQMKDVDTPSRKGGEKKADSLSNKTNGPDSVFAKSGSFARVNADFPKFKKRRLLRAYMSITLARLKKEMPKPPSPEQGGI